MAYVKGQPFIPQFVDPATGLLLASGTVEFYLTGTSTPTPYYTNSAGSSGGTSLTLGSGGKPATDIYFNTAITYKIVVKNAAGSILDTIDPFSVVEANVLTAVASIQATNLAGVASVQTLGYTSAGDGGAGLYRADTADAVTADDGFLCIVSNDGVRFKLVYGNVLTFKWAGCDGVVSTDCSAEVQALITATPAGGTIEGYPGDTYYFSEVTSSNAITTDGKGCTFKHKRNATLQNETSWNNWLSPFALNTTGQETFWTIVGDHTNFKNITLDGNGILYADSTGYANKLVKMFAVESARYVDFDNVHIADNNGCGLYTYASEYVTFRNGSILNTRGLIGGSGLGIFEQVMLVASRYCKVLYSELGGFSPGSCVSTAGGFVTVTDGTEVGGYMPYNTDTVDQTYIHFGRATGDSDTFHEVRGNICSSVLSAGEALGGGVHGRMITMNSGACKVLDNIVYDLSDLSQGGIGLGHDDQPTTGEIVYARLASRTEVAGNRVFGFRKSGQGYGILNNGSEDANVHDNVLYNNNAQIQHTRYATTSRYHSNDIFFGDVAFSIGDVASNTQSHGIKSAVEIKHNNCVGNLQDVITLDNGTYADLIINDNEFIQSSSVTSQQQFDCFHGLLEFNRNRIVNYSTGIVGEFFTRATGRHAECKGTTIECMTLSSADLLFFDGSSSDNVGRGRLTINDLEVDCPYSSLTITAATQANPCQITSAAHGLVTGAKIRTDTVGGMTELNGNTYIITVVDANNFTLDSTNSTAYGAYTSGGVAVSGTVNRRLNIRRKNRKGVNISDINMTGCKLTVQSKSGDVNINGGTITTFGTTDACAELSLADATDPKLILASNLIFPMAGAANPMDLLVSGTSGHIVVSNCISKENKEVTDTANGGTVQNVNCWKITAGSLTASRP